MFQMASALRNVKAEPTTNLHLTRASTALKTARNAMIHNAQAVQQVMF